MNQTSLQQTIGTWSGAMAWRIRAATPDDAATLAVLARAMLEWEQALDPTRGALTAWAASPAELHKQLTQPATRFFLAEQSGTLLGYIKLKTFGATMRAHGWRARQERWLQHLAWFVLRRPRPNTTPVGGYLAALYVAPAARRQGIGQALVVAAEQWFHAQGMPTSELHVLSANTEAQAFWQQLGYAPVMLGMRKSLVATSSHSSHPPSPTSP